MVDIKGVVNKPQFDLDVFKLGEAVRINGYFGVKPRRGNTIRGNAIITGITPLEVTAEYFNECDKELHSVRIPIEEVVGGFIYSFSEGGEIIG